MTSTTKRLIIFASGGGSNAEAIINYFSENDLAEVVLIVTNKKEAGVLQRADKHNIPTLVINKKALGRKEYLLPALAAYKPDLLILAGFLLLIPAHLVEAYPEAILNIHPALLPKYGGKGMYGHHVHQAVFDNNEKASGPTIHLVNTQYDEGQILFQTEVALDPMDTPDIIAQKVLALEHRHYPQVIEQYLLDRLT
jgi:phosphoribosylglycinamide formyltransferase-1